MGRHLANHSTELKRSLLNSVHLAPESSRNIPDQWRASYIPQKKSLHSHFNHLLLYYTTQLKIKCTQRQPECKKNLHQTVNLKSEKLQINSTFLPFIEARVVPTSSTILESLHITARHCKRHRKVGTRKI